MQLTRRKPTDAMGAVLDPAALYTPISPHARGQHHGVYNPEITQLRGNHEAVMAAPQLWIRADASTDEKHQALFAYRAAREAAEPTTPEVAPPIRILGPIPQARRRVALRNYHDKTGRIVHEGSVWDANDEFVRANPDMFGPEAA